MTHCTSVLLEKRIDNRWVRINIIQDAIIVPPMQFYLSPNSQREWGFSINYYYGHLETGNYQIATMLSDPPGGLFIMNTSTATMPPMSKLQASFGNFWVYAEFEIE